MKIFPWLGCLPLALASVAAAPDKEALLLSNELSSLVEHWKPAEARHQQVLESWCKNTLAAQSKRIGDIQNLLAKATPPAEVANRLQSLEKVLPTMHDALEKEVISRQAARGAQKQRVRDARLAIEDGAKDLVALQKAEAKLRGDGRSRALTRTASVVRGILAREEAEQKRRVKMLQIATRNSTHLQSVSALQDQFSRTQADAQTLEEEQRTAQRSEAVLLTALEDESQYLADLQGICDLQRLLYDRVEGKVMPALLGAVPKSRALLARAAVPTTTTTTTTTVATTTSTTTTTVRAAIRRKTTTTTTTTTKKMAKVPVKVKKTTTTTTTTTTSTTTTTTKATTTAATTTTTTTTTTTSTTFTTTTQVTTTTTTKSTTTTTTMPTTTISTTTATTTTNWLSGLAEASKEIEKKPTPKLSIAAIQFGSSNTPAPQGMDAYSDLLTADSPGLAAALASGRHEHPTISHHHKFQVAEPVHDSFMDAAYDAAAGTMPTTYASWKPSTQGFEQHKSEALAQMKAEFGDDDDDTEAPAPPPPVSKVKAPTPKQPAKQQIAQIQVSMTNSDDKSSSDDAPADPAPAKPEHKKWHDPYRHSHTDDSEDQAVEPSASQVHRSAPSSSDDSGAETAVHVKAPKGLEGGWQALMQKMPKKHHKHKQTDADMMEQLSATSSYAAWSPTTSTAVKPSDGGEWDAAVKDFDADSFLQLGTQVTFESTFARFLQAAAQTRESASSQVATMRGKKATQSAATERITAASLMLEVYSAVLHSKPLHQLSLSQLDVPQLEDLWSKLQTVDPMKHPNAHPSKGKQAQAEHWCEHFEQNLKQTGPLSAARMKLELANQATSKAAITRVAALQERNVRSQLLGTVEHDVQALTVLLRSVLHEHDNADKNLQAWEQRVGAEGMATSHEGLAVLDTVNSAQSVMTSAKTEMADLVSMAIRKRGVVVKRQQELLSKVTNEAQQADKQWQQDMKKTAHLKSALSAAANHVASAEKACDKVLEAAERRRHAGGREMTAIKMALLSLDQK